ncbi:hypothetical protein OR571_11170 [Psychrobacillus sp. NEAU-3TGS]|uniref:hypothetical protein n=1 Tax=Psychrobacillus sp. NEAU-3TGS TaxID=2995412 RepID=UPI0024965BCF|nr:hypothetical protein [Psychrobacillus sp. NEAU-3TGS]MDI2587658.1 hypothetical protein [Psychrobacillus sp. NEAU-3TGS]
MNNREKYRELCKKEKNIPIFSKDWWLDAVAGEGKWDVILVEKGDEIVASLPYVIKKKFSFNYITMPMLTQTAGIWIKYPEGQKYVKKYLLKEKFVKKLSEKFQL